MTTIVVDITVVFVLAMTPCRGCLLLDLVRRPCQVTTSRTSIPYISHRLDDTHLCHTHSQTHTSTIGHHAELNTEREETECPKRPRSRKVPLDETFLGDMTRTRASKADRCC